MSERAENPPVSEEETLDLVRRCIEGDDAAWRIFYEHCCRVLSGPIRSFRLPRDWVSEIFPDFLHYLWANECRVLSTYRPQPPSRFDSWLRVCFRRFAVRWIRTRPLPRWDATIDPEVILDASRSAAGEDPHLLLGVSRVFDQLTERERRILSLCVSRVAYTEIGARVGMREGAVAVAVQRLRTRLRALLSAQVLELDPSRSSSNGRRSSRKRE